ncbi:glycoside hydrolase family 2 TIM barrel-domain containing protein [Pontiella sulfatireligans]|uniref:Beta-galactosidase BoGH2A n=1 Tax=Pontiella sulfatireligans TaxID=2750658 RepID=A0A6C2UEZ4_9BACT|nr:glycoside hydrolase family 2 TIM barrel-domain containing protein [Pontiella sulfatireligans]VGO18489.1 Beta-galactosidase BoGH2A [Pontiella sulfatireligans]
MNKTIIIAGLVLCGAAYVGAQNNGLMNFNDGWLFTETDSGDYSLTTYQPEGWEKVDLPHDWSIEKDFSQELEGCTAFLPGGIGWYTKVFDTPIQKNQKCYIVFDGVYNNAEFWLNGIKIGDHPFGYAPIHYDLTDLLAPAGRENRFSVRVDHSRYADSRWYTGSGIYRNVHMLIADKLHIPVWGTFIATPKVSKDKATVELKVEVANDYDAKRKGSIVTDVFDEDGTKEASVSTSFSIGSNEESVYTQKIKVAKPKLWSVDHPLLYTAKTRIVTEGHALEERSTRFGIRSIRFDKDKGFFLNEENMKIKGVCLHHDAGIVGTAVPKDVWKRRLQLLKDGGCNAIRSSHNPASDEFLDLCDELGFLVQNEFYDEWDLPKDKRYNMQDKEVDYITRGHSEHFQTWAEIDLKNTMRSGRNHPSIFQWSIGNEIEWTYPGNRGATGIFKEEDKNDKMDWTLWRTETPPHTPEQVREYLADFPEQTFDIGETARKLAKWTREMDTTRPVTANCILPTASFETGYIDALDVIGYSYKPHKYDYFKKTYPDKPMLGTENVPRWYEWKAVVERDFIPGLFLWTGVDYMGECREKHWPVKATPHGPLDVAGFPRGSFYQYKSFWREDVPTLAMYSQTAKKSTFKKDKNGKAIEKKKDGWKLAPREWQHVNPHWNYLDGEETMVEIYSNCEVVELFLNGKSFGKQFLNDQEDRIYKWPVSYEAGELAAKGTWGKQVVNAKLETAGAPASIRLTADRRQMAANKTDVVHVTAQLVDARGRAVKNVDEEITFEVHGPHKFLGTDCGDTAKLKNFKGKTVPTAFGRCLMIIQATDQPANLRIAAKSKDGRLGSNIANIEVK